MRLSFLRFVAAAFAIVVLMPTSAHAIIRTIDFTASGLNITSGDPFGILGISQQETVTGSFSFETTAAQFDVFNNGGDATSERSFASIPYINFFADVGPITLNGGTDSSDKITIADAPGNTRKHLFQIVSLTDVQSPSVILGIMNIGLLSTNTENPFDSTAVPSLAILNSLTAIRGFEFLVEGVSNNFGAVKYTNITLSEVPAVPVPASLPLFGTGLALMGFIGWRRKRKLAATA